MGWREVLHCTVDESTRSSNTGNIHAPEQARYTADPSPGASVRRPVIGRPCLFVKAFGVRNTPSINLIRCNGPEVPRTTRESKTRCLPGPDRPHGRGTKSPSMTASIPSSCGSNARQFYVRNECTHGCLSQHEMNARGCRRDCCLRAPTPLCGHGLETFRGCGVERTLSRVYWRVVYLHSAWSFPFAHVYISTRGWQSRHSPRRGSLGPAVRPP